jgi:hypothetical protein
MIELSEHRVSELLLASVIQASIIFANIGLILYIDNLFSLIHDSAIWCWSGENQ